MDSTVKERGLQRGKGENKKSLLRGSRRKLERVSGRKGSPGRSAGSWFHSKCGQTRNGKGGWETRSPLIR